MSRLAAIVTLHATGSTVADLDEFVSAAGRLGAGDDVVLLEGGDARLEDDVHHLGEVAPPGRAHGTVGGLRRWLDAARAAGVGWGEVISGLDVVAVDLDVVAVEVSACSDHVGAEPPALFVSVDRRCAEHLVGAGVTVLDPA
jgi:hypothetical protein